MKDDGGGGRDACGWDQLALGLDSYIRRIRGPRVVYRRLSQSRV
jgi:hypothetical protein